MTNNPVIKLDQNLQTNGLLMYKHSTNLQQSELPLVANVFFRVLLISIIIDGFRVEHRRLFAFNNQGFGRAKIDKDIVLYSQR